MITVQRYEKNPILLPSSRNSWEENGTFNGSVIEDEHGVIHMVYRALSAQQTYKGHSLQLSTIGHAVSFDGLHFESHAQLITPTEDWDAFGCEDPRIAKVGDRYFIFYTALSNYPFSADSIKIAVAITRDFKTIEEKHLITPFNAKAMILFPERINGKLVALLTANTDKPPAKIGIAHFESEDELWSTNFWEGWYQYLDDRLVPLLRNASDQIEVGATPLKTEFGWLFLYSYIRNYFHAESRAFTIEAAFLNLEHPHNIVGRLSEPLLFPEESYETMGNIPNVVFPTGALIKSNSLYIYYGAADTTTAVATVPIEMLLKQASKPYSVKLERFVENPIIRPIKLRPWEEKATLNPAAIYINGKFHIIYRAMSKENVSTFGYAVSSDGFHIDERLPNPIYTPREDFEKKKNPVNNSGCEDPRITQIEDKLYMCYTAYDGVNPPRVALTSITEENFLKKNWTWEKPILISPPGVDDKDACIFSRKINDKYVFLHRFKSAIWIDFLEDISFQTGNYLYGKILLEPRIYNWDNVKIGITAPPLETPDGWLLLYHGVTKPGNYYKIGAVLLDKEDPSKILGQTNAPIFEPEMLYEREGIVPNVIFPCGIVCVDGELFVYYGGADSVVAVATISLGRLLKELE